MYENTKRPHPRQLVSDLSFGSLSVAVWHVDEVDGPNFYSKDRETGDLLDTNLSAERLTKLPNKFEYILG